MRVAFIFIALSFALCTTGQELPISDANLVLWVRADSNVVTTTGDRVTDWYDMSSAENHLYQSVNNFRPVLTEEVLNGHAAVRYDGGNDNLLFPTIDNARTLFWVLREDPDASLIWRPLVGDVEEADYFRGIGGTLWHPSISNEAVREGLTRVNFSAIDGVEQGLDDGFNLVSLLTTGATTISQLSRDRTNAGVWDGDMLEFLVFDAPLSENDIEAVENWLAEYYTQSLVVSDDVVVESGVCDTVISANEGFVSYTWSTGETTPSVAVNTSGSYWVEVTDAFGRVASDTVEVSFPGVFAPPDENILCYGDSLLWDSELPEDDIYSFQWNNGFEGPAAWLSDAGEYQFTITDDEGCVFVSELFFLAVDSFPLTATLGDELDLCAGDELALQLGNPDEEVSSYEWMDDPENNMPTFDVDTSGEYVLEAINANGCVLQDTAVVNIVGNAPEVVILGPAVLCEGAPLNFTGSATADSFITSWEWAFPDDETASGQSTVYDAGEYGDLDVDLTVSTEAGCVTTVTESFTVHPLPLGSIQSGLSCSGTDVIFATTSGIPEGFVNEILWNFNGETQEGTIATYIDVPPGFQTLDLTITSGAGCSLELSQMIEVLASPVPVIDELSGCAGSLVDFGADIDAEASGPITNYTWFFGDSNSSNQASPQHLYPGAGSYNVQLQVHAENGCIGIDEQFIDVYTPPIADFSVANACLDTPFPIEDLSEGQGTDIVAWSWDLEEIGVLEGPEIAPVWESEGLKEVTLIVTSEAGCTDSRTRQIPVFTLPQADFSFDPPIGLAPLEVNFSNLSLGATSFSWDFGTGAFSDALNPVYTFEENGQYEIALTAVNQYGCAHRYTDVIDVTFPVLDLAVLELNANEVDEGIELSALIYNNGNFVAENARVYLDMGNGVPALAYLGAHLPPGGAQWFTWPVILNVSGSDYLCLEVRGDEDIAAESQPADNRACTSMADTDFSLTVYPNPISAANEVNLRLISSDDDEGAVMIYDASGRLVFESEPIAVNSGFNAYTLNTQGLKAGTYQLVYRSALRVETRKLVIY